MGEQSNTEGPSQPAGPAGTSREQIADDEQHKRLLEDQKRKRVPLGARPPFVIVGGVLIALIVAILLWQRAGTSQPPPTALTPTPAPTTVAVASPAPTITPSPTATPDTGKPIAERYKEGLDAYDAQNWEGAYVSLSSVYAENPTYERVAEALGATCYNWGVALLNIDAADTEAQFNLARTRFEEARFFNPQHPLAAGRIGQLDRYQEAVRASDAPTSTLAILAPLMDELLANAAPAVENGENQLRGLFVRVVAQRLLRTYETIATSQMEAGDAASARKAYGDARASYTKAIAALEKVGKLPPEAVAIEEAKARLDAAQQKLAQLPTPTPPNRVFAATAPNPNFSKEGGSGRQESCVGGYIKGRKGPIDAAVVEVNNGRGVTARTISGNGGQYTICGMGADDWSVSLLFIPGTPPLFIKPPPYRSFSVNGNSDQRVRVDFNER